MNAAGNDSQYEQDQTKEKSTVCLDVSWAFQCTMITAFVQSMYLIPQFSHLGVSLEWGSSTLLWKRCLRIQKLQRLTSVAGRQVSGQLRARSIPRVVIRWRLC